MTYHIKKSSNDDADIILNFNKELAKKGFCLPSSVNLDNKMINKVCEVLNSIVNLNKMVGNI